MSTVYGVLADIVISAHLAWILFLIFGALWGRRHRWVKALHMGGLAFAFVIGLFDIYCPLTYLEVWLQRMSSPEGGYAGTFIGHYLEDLIYVDVSRWAIFGLTVILCAANAWIYLGRRKKATSDG